MLENAAPPCQDCDGVSNGAGNTSVTFSEITFPLQSLPFLGVGGGAWLQLTSALWFWAVFPGKYFLGNMMIENHDDSGLNVLSKMKKNFRSNASPNWTAIFKELHSITSGQSFVPKTVDVGQVDTYCHRCLLRSLVDRDTWTVGCCHPGQHRYPH